MCLLCTPDFRKSDSGKTRALVRLLAKPTFCCCAALEHPTVPPKIALVLEVEPVLEAGFWCLARADTASPGLCAPDVPLASFSETAALLLFNTSAKLRKVLAELACCET